MPFVQIRSLDLLTSSTARYHCITDVPNGKRTSKARYHCTTDATKAKRTSKANQRCRDVTMTMSWITLPSLHQLGNWKCQKYPTRIFWQFGPIPVGISIAGCWFAHRREGLGACGACGGAIKLDPRSRVLGFDSRSASRVNALVKLGIHIASVHPSVMGTWCTDPNLEPQLQLHLIIRWEIKQDGMYDRMTVDT